MAPFIMRIYALAAADILPASVSDGLSKLLQLQPLGGRRAAGAERAVHLERGQVHAAQQGEARADEGHEGGEPREEGLGWVSVSVSVRQALSFPLCDAFSLCSF